MTLVPLFVAYAVHNPDTGRWLSGYTLLLDSNIACMFLLSLP